jgi:uncharacterized coiled-coil protein SlyX
MSSPYPDTIAEAKLLQLQAELADANRLIDELKVQSAAANADADQKQAHIDQLMREFCPHRMSMDQVLDWAQELVLKDTKEL